jgi:hypothetical protein
LLEDSPDKVPFADNDIALACENTDEALEKVDHPRVVIMVDEDEEHHSDKYSLIAVLTALAQHRADDPSFEPVVPSSESGSGVTWVDSGIVVVSGGKARAKAQDCSPYVALFSPKLQQENHPGTHSFAAEVYAGTESNTCEVPRFQSDFVTEELLWTPGDALARGAHVVCRVFVLPSSQLHVTIIAVDDSQKLCDRDVIQGKARLSSSQLSKWIFDAPNIDAL